ncbi:MAG: family 16 glycosylhydrolase [Sphingomonadaceae bacterium]
MSFCAIVGNSLSAIALIAASSSSALSQTSSTAALAAEQTSAKTKIPAGYELVWSDEFSKAGLVDPDKWRYDVVRNQKGWFNNEKQYYADARAKNSRVENGHLIIEAHKEDMAGAGLPDWGKQKYSSARLVSKDAGSWTYGFFEIRAKLPCGVGTWPAIWMLPTDTKVEWPKGGEIDIMEHVGFDPGVVHQSIHTLAFNFSNNTQKTTKRTIKDACQVMHKYQLLWTDQFILTGIDDAPIFLFKKETGNPKIWPFDRPQSLLLNIAVGGDWGGQKGIQDTAFPAKMEIDYVRVYQRPAASEKQ